MVKKINQLTPRRLGQPTKGPLTAKKGLPLNGWINLHKPLEISSNDAVQAVKRALRPQKIGHGGTLDPLASGVLPLALGEATKTVFLRHGWHQNLCDQGRLWGCHQHR